MNKSTYNSHLKAFHNLHKGKIGILFATGASTEKYIPIPGNDEAIKVGVNHIYRNEKILNTLDYYFFGSSYETNLPQKQNIDKIDPKIQKFASAYRDGKETGFGNISPDHARLINAIPFECGLVEFAKDISEEKMLGHSIVFPTMQFLLYTGVHKIYIVGCDIDNYHEPENIAHYKEWWQKLKNWVVNAYPDVEIIVVNPIGLKGFFSELYQY